MADTDILIRPEPLQDYIAAICRAAGSSADEAGKIATQLIEANLRGHDSHGVGMIPYYIANARARTLTPNGRATVVSETDVITVLDGGFGYGQVIGEQVMEIGIAKAKVKGVALIALRNSHHLGRIGGWAEQCAAAGMASIHYVSTVGSGPAVAPFGGTDARFGTNPFCCGVPVEGNEPIILDMATSRLPIGKIRVAHNKGEAIVEGALLDANGAPTTDPGVFFRQPRGTLLPFGEHKGYALALVVELFAGALTGGLLAYRGEDIPKCIVNNMLSVIIDPKALGEARQYYEAVRAMTEFVKASPPGKGTDRVMVPGDPERRSRAKRLADGIPIDAETWREIGEAARSVGVNARPGA
ncbi:MAG: malate/lactate/ureidoglycolate dehydrogenase [Alphaproteobacteria bacterium]|nr:malate/lactate/ureidoglycolate dehydrogenase [Alphaproteobacteria bacterium]